MSSEFGRKSVDLVPSTEDRTSKGERWILDNANIGRSFTSRVAHWSARHRWLIMAASVAVIVGAFLSISFVGADTRGDDAGVGESGQGNELLHERFNSAPADTLETRRTRNEG